MKTSREKAEEFLAERALKESYAEELADFIKQDRVEQREACGKAAMRYLSSLGVTEAVAVAEVCINAGVEE